MNATLVTFYFVTGIKKPVFRNARLKGSWGANGVYSDEWTETDMQEITWTDGCPAFMAKVSIQFEDEQTSFKWGVIVDSPAGPNFWGIVTEVPDAFSGERYRVFKPSADGAQTEIYHFSYCRYLGANKFADPESGETRLKFSVWAPHARAVSVVFGKKESGYIDDNGDGANTAIPEIPLRHIQSGIWAGLSEQIFQQYKSEPYMFKITNAQGKTVYRTDIFSRSQIGSGDQNPAHTPDWDGQNCTLNGSKSCSVVIDPDLIRTEFAPAEPGIPTSLVSEEKFWEHEFDINKPLPANVGDLVIYELHVGALGFGSEEPGTLKDAIELLDYLVDLGVNAVEMLPMADFSGDEGWGYGSTHHMVIHSAAGGRDQYRHFIRECHRRGIAVIQDVVFNHYDGDAERAQSQYDSEEPEENIYYWYEKGEYSNPNGGYLDNGSSGWAPDYRSEVVRQQFISASVFLIEEMHVDGLRVDLTQAIHRDNALHFDGRPVPEANLYGQKLLREWSRTLKMIRPSTILIAEDHTGWQAVAIPPADGGLGFDATWDVNFYHALVGDSDSSGGNAKLLKEAGFGHNGPLAMDHFAAILHESQFRKVVYHESHDEAGNAGGSARTMSVAVNKAPVIGDTRRWAEMRSRVVFGISVLSPGTPMFLMGEEIGAMKNYTYDQFVHNREDLHGERQGDGAGMFRFYQDLIRLSRELDCIRTRNLDILHIHNENRVLAFKRYAAQEQVLVVASLNNFPFEHYQIHSDEFRLPDGLWKEIFNSDSEVYGGTNTGNAGAALPVHAGGITLTVPANAILAFVRM